MEAIICQVGNGAQMLYDHSRDPDENLNVANNPEYAEVIDRMSRRLKSITIRF